MGLLADFPQLVDSSKGRNEADPWVVVVAELAGATVVTEEGSRPRNPRIPDICRRRATSFCRLLDVIVAEGWRFHSDLG